MASTSRDLEPESFWAKYISKRRPVVIHGGIPDLECKAPALWTDSYLKKHAVSRGSPADPLHFTICTVSNPGTPLVTVPATFTRAREIEAGACRPSGSIPRLASTHGELRMIPRAHDPISADLRVRRQLSLFLFAGMHPDRGPSALRAQGKCKVLAERRLRGPGPAFGRGERACMLFADVVDAAAAGDDSVYMTAQHPEGDLLVAPPLRGKLAADLPRAPRLAERLELQSVNMWMGASADGASSGLHHDFHDNVVRSQAANERRCAVIVSVRSNCSFNATLFDGRM